MKYLFSAIMVIVLAGVVAAQNAQKAKPDLAPIVTIGGFHIRTASPPKGIVLRTDLGLLTGSAVHGQVVYQAEEHAWEPRATITPSGDYLLMFASGAHYGSSVKAKVNEMIEFRSSDKGKTWTGPKLAFDSYSQHTANFLIPRGSRRIYVFGTQPIPGMRQGQEDCPIGFHWSDDDGHTWSKVQLIRPVNDPRFVGMGWPIIETDSGTWLLSADNSDWSIKPVRTRQYILRSVDRGKTWTVLPHPQPDGWYAKGFDRGEEGRPINLGGGKVLLMFRTPTGHLWATWSDDDGKTWTDPKPTPLVQPDAPPMVFWMPDGKTLAAFIHNRNSVVHYTGFLGTQADKDRSEIWVSFSEDEGHTWSEPRFVFANALGETNEGTFFDYQCTYDWAFADGEYMHLFVSHRWKTVLHLWVKASDLSRMPTKEEIAQSLRRMQ